MYDTINLTLKAVQCGYNDFQEYCASIELESKETRVIDTDFNIIVCRGFLRGLLVCVYYDTVKVKGSLARFFLGSNYHTLTRKDTQRALEELEGRLQLPIKDATVTRLDIAINFTTLHGVEYYTSAMQGIAGYKSKLINENKYFSKGTKSNKMQVLAVYDKKEEINRKASKGKAQSNGLELLQGINLIRFELRFINRLNSFFGVQRFTAEMLYNESMYIKIIDKFVDVLLTKLCFRKEIDFSRMRTKKDYLDLLLLLGLERFADVQGRTFEEYLKDATAKGVISSSNASKLRANIRNVANSNFLLETEQETELKEMLKRLLNSYR